MTTACSRPGRWGICCLMVQAKDPDTYIEVMKENTAPFEALGSSVAGVCDKRPAPTIRGRCSSGMRLIQWSKQWLPRCLRPHESARKLAALRDVKYNVMFKPLKAFELEPNSEDSGG